MQRPAAGSKLRFSVAHATGEVRHPSTPTHPPPLAIPRPIYMGLSHVPHLLFFIIIFLIFLFSFFFSRTTANTRVKHLFSPHTHQQRTSLSFLSHYPSQDPDYPARELHFHTPQTRQGITHAPRSR